MAKINRNNIDIDDFSEIDLVKSYQHLKKEKIEDFYGINNNGNYTPENCRFVTAKVNANNRRKRNDRTKKETM